MKRKPIIDRDGEVRELTKAEIKRMRPAREVLPELVAAQKAGNLQIRKASSRTMLKKPVIRLPLDADVLAFFKSKGTDWQTRIGAALRAFVDAAR